MPFFIIFIIIPFVEIMVFMAIGEHIGIFTTLLLALLTAIIGGMLVKHQGIQTLIAMRMASAHGKIPLSEIFDGFCLVAAGAMLITPGFVTDTLGFLLLVPSVRSLLKTLIKNHTNWSLEEQSFQSHTYNTTYSNSEIIEGECEIIEDERLNK